MNEADLDGMFVAAAALVTASPLAIEDKLDSRDKLIRIAAVIAARKLNKLENALLQEVLLHPGRGYARFGIRAPYPTEMEAEPVTSRYESDRERSEETFQHWCGLNFEEFDKLLEAMLAMPRGINFRGPRNVHGQYTLVLLGLGLGLYTCSAASAALLLSSATAAAFPTVELMESTTCCGILSAAPLVSPSFSPLVAPSAALLVVSSVAPFQGLMTMPYFFLAIAFEIW